MPDGNIQLTVTLTPQDVKAKAVSLRNEIQKIFDTTSADGLTKSMQNIMSTMDGLNTKAQAVHKTMHEMETTKVVNPRIKELTDQITTAGRELNNLLDTRKKLTDEGKTPKGGWEKFNQGVDEALQRVTRLSLERSDIYKSGQEFVTQAQADPAKYEAQKVALAGLNDAMAVNIARFQDEQYAITQVSEDESLWVRATDQATTSTDRFNQSLGNTGGAIANARRHTNKFTSALKGKFVGALERVKAGFQKAFSVKGMLSGLKTLIKYTLGVSSLLYAFKKLANMAKEGLHNLVQYQSGTNQTNKAMTSFQTSLLYIKNAWAAAFAPVLNFVMPILTRLMDMLADVGNTIARFIATLTGQKQAIQAVKVNAQDYATSIGKAAKNQEKLNKKLAAFDDLNVLGKDNDTSGAYGSDGTPNPSDMFTTIDVDQDEFADILGWLDKIKQKVEDSGLLDALGDLKTAFDKFKDSPFVTTMKEILGIIADNTFTSVLGLLTDVTGGLAAFLSGDALGSLGSLRDILADLTFDPLITLGDVLDNLLGTNIGDWFRELKEAIKNIKIEELPGWDKLQESLDKFKGSWEKLKTAIQTGWKTLEDAGILDAVKSFITWLWEQHIDGLLKGIATALDTLGGAMEFVADIMNGDFGAALDDIKNIWATLTFQPLETLAGIIDSIFGTDIAGWIKGVEDAIKNFSISDFLDKLGKAFEQFKQDPFGTIKQSWETLTGKIKSINLNPFDKITEGWEILSTKLKSIDWTKVGQDIGIKVGEAIKNLGTKLSEAGTNFKTFFTVTVPGFVTTEVPKWWDTIKTKAKTFFTTTLPNALVKDIPNALKSVGTSVWNGIKAGWNALITAGKAKTDFVNGLVNGIKKGLGVDKPEDSAIGKTGKTLINGFITNLKNGVKGVWDKIKGTVDDFVKKFKTAILGTEGKVNGEKTLIGGFLGGILAGFRDLKNKLKSPINGVIGLIESFVNYCIRGINDLTTKLNNIKITIGSTTYGFNFPKISDVKLPRLAEGAVIPPNREFLAVLGDQSRGTNIEAPLDVIKQAVAEVVGGNNDSEVVRLLNELLIELRRKELKVGDKEIGKANERYQANQRVIRGTAI